MSDENNVVGFIFTNIHEKKNQKLDNEKSLGECGIVGKNKMVVCRGRSDAKGSRLYHDWAG